MNEILLIPKRILISVLPALFAVMFVQGYGAPAYAADNYSAEEKIYLKTVTPILFEYSQVASQVSANVLPLQSAPAENCSSRFSYYYGIMSSLGKHLGTITPPARFETVQANSASAISEYETSLNLYSAACTQEDFGTKEELVSRAGAGVNRSVATISRVYKEIEALGVAAAAPPPAAGSPVSENLSESAIEPAPSGESVEDVYVEEQNVEAATPPAPAAPPAPKTREEVIRNLAEEADTAAAPAAPVVEAPKPAAPPAVKAPEPVKPAPPAPAEAPAETAKIEAPEAVAPAPKPVEPAPAETKKLPEPEKPKAAEAEPVPVPAPAAETTAVPAPAAPEKPAPAPEVTLPPAPQEGASTVEVVPQPLPSEGETVTEKSMDTAALAPGMAEEELQEEALPEDEISSWCSRYQTDFERAGCVKKRTEARDKAGVLSTSFEDGTPEKEIVEKCRADWKEGVTYNYEMVVSCTQFFCTQKGLEACKELAK